MKRPATDFPSPVCRATTRAATASSLKTAELLLLGDHRNDHRTTTQTSRDPATDDAAHRLLQDVGVLAAGRSRGEIQALLARMVPLVGLRFAGEHILITHAGLDPATIDRITGILEPATGPGTLKSTASNKHGALLLAALIAITVIAACL